MTPSYRPGLVVQKWGVNPDFKQPKAREEMVRQVKLDLHPDNPAIHPKMGVREVDFIDGLHVHGMV